MRHKCMFSRCPQSLFYMFCSFCSFLLILWIEKQLNLVVPEKGRPVAHSGEKEEIHKPDGSRKGETCGSLFLLTLIGALTVLETTLVIYQMSFCIADVRMFIVYDFILENTFNALQTFFTEVHFVSFQMI